MENEMFQLGDASKLVNYMPFADLFSKGVSYKVLAEELAKSPQLLAILKDLPLAKNQVLILDVVLRNDDAKQYSDLYKSNAYLQYVATRFENDAFQNGCAAIERYITLKRYEFSVNGEMDSYIDKALKRVLKDAKKTWAGLFYSDKYRKGYIPIDGENFYHFNLTREFFDQKDAEYFNKKVIENNIDLSEWLNEENVSRVLNQDDMKRIYTEYANRQFEKNLMPIFEYYFDEFVPVNKINDILYGDSQELIKKAGEGKI